MKNTIIMLATIATFLLTWFCLTIIVYLLSEGITFKCTMTLPGVIGFMLLIGWLPAVIVAVDIDEKLF